jgi:hypothetical protein
MSRVSCAIALAGVCGVLLVACGVEEERVGEGEGEGEDNDIETVTSAFESTGMPTGAVCGLAYRRPGSAVYGNNHCEGFRTLVTFPNNTLCAVDGPFPTTTNGYLKVADGDRGLPACNGFYHYRFNRVGTVDSRQYRLPRGTACGFKEACNNSGESCMGFDANVSCPPGWFKKSAWDLNAPSGCGFVWCEYQDPNNLCTAEPCISKNQPFGHVCGITDSDRDNGQCVGTPTTYGCPAGYTRYGYFDDGRSAGRGVGWCAKTTQLP